MLHQVTTNYVCGIDLHAKTLSVCIMNLIGKIIKRITLKCDKKAIIDFLSPWKGDITVGVESTYNWYWLVDCLNENNITCLLGHALYISRMKSGKHKNDPVDARDIADLIRTNSFPTSYNYPKESRAIRDLLRRRHFYVRLRAGTYIHFKCSLHQDCITSSIGTKLQTKSTRNTLVTLTDDKKIQQNLQTDLTYIEALDTIIKDIERELKKEVQQQYQSDYYLLQTMPGCGPITALTVLYESGTISRFKSQQRFSSYCRVVRADNHSAGKYYGRSSNDKIGNAYLKWAISEICINMIRYDDQIKNWLEKNKRKIGSPKTHAQLRHKVAVAIYHMLKHNKKFDCDKFLNTRKYRKRTPAKNKKVMTKKESGILKNKTVFKQSKKVIKKNKMGRITPVLTEKRTNR